MSIATIENFFNQNRLFLGIAILVGSIGGKAMYDEVSKYAPRLFESGVGRRLVVFCIAFMSTRDFSLSLWITLGYMLLVYLLCKKKTDDDVNVKA